MAIIAGVCVNVTLSQVFLIERNLSTISAIWIVTVLTVTGLRMLTNDINGITENGLPRVVGFIFGSLMIYGLDIIDSEYLYVYS